MSDLLFQQFSTVQSIQQQMPMTIPAAATIAPQTLITFLTGSTNVATITPPVTGQHILALIYTGTVGSLLTTGNILVGSTTLVTNRPVLLLFDPIQAKYYPMNHAA